MANQLYALFVKVNGKWKRASEAAFPRKQAVVTFQSTLLNYSMEGIESSLQVVKDNPNDPLPVDKTLKWEKVPACQLCNKQGEDVYDAPVKSLRGLWAYVCKACAIEHNANTSIGFHIVKV